MVLLQVVIFLYYLCSTTIYADTYDVVFKEYPDPCDVVAAQQCEYENLICKLFTGPANDPATVCRCGADFYGACLRRAGVRALHCYDFFHCMIIVLGLLIFELYSVKCTKKSVH